MHLFFKTFIFLVAIAVACQAYLVPLNKEAMTGEPTKAAIQFSVDLLNRITANQQNTTNVVYSPWSIFSTLNMLQLGLVDQSLSQKELNRLLQITPETKLKRHELMARIAKDMNTVPTDSLASNELKFILANKILFNKNLVKLNPNYPLNLSKYYSATIEPFVLGSPNELPVHEKVNQWVKNATFGAIKNIADSGLSSDPNLALVLLNAAYFKGEWLHIFNKTKLARFYNAGDSKNPIDAIFMEIKGHPDRMFDYGEFGSDVRSEFSPKTDEEKRLHELTKDLNCTALLLPYNLNGGKDFSMLLVLPDEIDGISQLQSKLSDKTLDAIIKSLKTTVVTVSLPKFEFETSIEVPQYLKSMQVNSIFQASHDFKEMFNSDKQFAVDKITHKSKIKVDEKGTEAAGATLMTVFKKVATRGPSFSANRPFIFMIRHNKSGMPLFIGRVNTVAESAPPRFPFDSL